MGVEEKVAITAQVCRDNRESERLEQWLESWEPYSTV